MRQRSFKIWVMGVLALGTVLLGAGTLRRGLRGQPPEAKAQTLPSPPAAVKVLTDLEEAFSHIAQTVRPAVVSVIAETKFNAPAMQGSDPFFDDPFFRHFFGEPFRPFRRGPQTFRQRGAGSGVIVDAQGHILTNNHVIEGADKVTVTLSDAQRTEWKATIVGTDPRTDLAVLKVNASKPLPAATLGDSSKVKVGQWAIAIGNQLGEFDATMTVGVVSATGRRLRDLGNADSDYRDLIQTDAAINRGNSGGPLVNVRGEVIGINTAIASPTGGSVGIGFAIPINTAKQVMESLIAHGKVERGYLGVYIQTLDEALKKFYGVEGGALVQRVEPHGPAEKAGVRPEDVIVSVNDKKVADADEARNVISSLPPNSTVRLGIVRDKKPMTLTVQLGSLPSSSRRSAQGARSEPTEHKRLGITAAPLDEETRQRLRLDRTIGGVLITDVASDSPAERAGLQPGDIILRVDRTPVSNPDDLTRALGDLEKRDSVVLKIRRGGEEQVVAVKLKEE
jgi:serine protease Do